MVQFQQKSFSKVALLIIAFFIVPLLNIGVKVVAQNPVKVGKGSYAEYPPLSKSWTNEHSGDKSRIMQTKELFIREDGEPIPTNDWWTDLLNTRYSGNLWAYPQVVNAEDYGIYIAYPTFWSPDGCEMKWNTQLEITGSKFYPESAIAENWHDWGLEMKLAQGEKEMKVTLAHGIPFTWVETKNIVPQFRVKNARFFTVSKEISLPVTTNRLVVMLGEDAYGIYVPDGTSFEQKGDLVSIKFNGSKQFISVAVLPQKEDLDAFASYAYVIPRSTDVKWDYNETTGKVASTWKVSTENLIGGSERNILQGFIPHHYKRSEMNFSFTDYTYATPRGKMKMAEGNTFTVTYDFNGILPYYAAPKEMQDLSSPYNRERMKQMIADYADKGSFGADTYWGGKGLTQMALYMTFAYEMGETELFEKCRQRLKDVMVNWLTYTPGENNFFFARYQRWGALIGYDTSYDSDTFNDHHFHYGYYTYAGALLALFDEDFCRNYGEMLTLVAKDYANWDKSDKDFPFFRTFDPWAGHSYAGGLGGWNGNGQESTSEAMQGWGGMYLLGVATGNKEMRDAAIFGWTAESRGVAEYWFDRDNENINRELYTKPYNSNLTSQGIGWWTWFSGDPVWMHSIQWMPISPCLKYLSEDLDFARRDYAQMWDKKEIGGWENENANGESLGKESGLGNVVLSYLQRFDPDSAANVFERMWNEDKPTVKNPDTGGISYYILHSHRTYGDIDWEVHADIPTATTYKNKDGVYTYVVYNPEISEKTVTFYRNNIAEKKIKAPGHKLTGYSSAPYASAIEIVKPASLIVPPGQKLQLSARITDQYGATVEGTPVWKVNNSYGSISQGLFTAGNVKGQTCTVTATLGELSATIDLMINDKAVLNKAEIEPQQPYLEVGKSLNFSLKAEDQYGNAYLTKVDWKIMKDGQVVKTDSILDVQTVGIYTVQATADGKTYSEQVYLSPKLANIALNKKAYSSSEENTGTLTRYVTDGDKTTRWGSEHADNQWVYVDLGEKSYISHVSLVWEASYASLYEIQVSDNGKSWTTLKTVNGLGGTESIDLNCEARYIKMNGLQRATSYGFSLYEFEVYGVPSSLSEDDILGIQITAPSMLLKQGESIQLQGTAYNGKGEVVPAQLSWKVNGDGTIINGLFTPQQYGNVTVEAASGNKKAAATFVVEESINLTSVEVSPGSAVLVVGDSQEFDITFLDQFGCNIPVEGLEYKITGEGKATFVNNRFTATTPGDYKLIVGKGKVSKTINIKVAQIEDVNLAFNKPARASGSEGENMPSNVNDGDMSTRWGSSFEDGAYIQIDLEGSYIINRFKLFWEASYATAYRIDVSLDEEDWTTVYEKSSCRGGNEDFTIEETAARYIRLVCLKRSSVYGASLWEMEVYGNAKWDNPVPTDIQVLPQPLVFYCDETTPLETIVLDQYGIALQKDKTVVYTPNGGGTIVNGNSFKATTTGDYTLKVSYGTLQKEFPFSVYPKRVLSRMVVEPEYYKLKAGESLELKAKGFDQYGNPYTVNPNWSCKAEGVISASGVFCTNNLGTYVVTATASGMTATANIEVISIDNTNLVLKKPVETSSGDGNAAVDGNGGTRWISSEHDGPEWIKVDMQDAYLVTDIEIDWETASAADYEVQISPNGEIWNTLQSVSDKTGKRTDKFRVSGMGRYLRIYCTRRSTVWGYSIFELRAFGEKVKPEEPYYIHLIDPVKTLTVGETVKYVAEVRDIDDRLIVDYPLNWSVTGGKIDVDGTYHATLVGDYLLTVSCKLANFTLPISVQSFTGLNEVNKAMVVRNGNELRISGDDIEDVMLFDIQGKMIIINKVREADEFTIEVGNRTGIYVLMIRKRVGHEVLKIVL